MCQVFKITLNVLKRHETVTDNPSIMIYKNKIENRITTGYYLELLMPNTMKLLGSTKSKINKDINGEYVLHLEITELIVLNKSFGQLLVISPKKFMFLKILIQNSHTLKHGLLIKILINLYKQKIKHTSL